MKKEQMQELKSELAHWTGTENYYQGVFGTLYTDGAMELMQKAECYWLGSDIEVICKIKLKNQPFIVIKLQVNDKHQAKAIYEDGNDNKLFEQKYKYTDLPETEIELFFNNNVLMLPQEY